jgi:hypothetical protein
MKIVGFRMLWNDYAREISPNLTPLLKYKVQSKGQYFSESY